MTHRSLLARYDTPPPGSREPFYLIPLFSPRLFHIIVFFLFFFHFLFLFLLFFIFFFLTLPSLLFFFFSFLFQFFLLYHNHHHLFPLRSPPSSTSLEPRPGLRAGRRTQNIKASVYWPSYYSLPLLLVLILTTSSLGSQTVIKSEIHRFVNTCSDLTQNMTICNL